MEVIQTHKPAKNVLEYFTKPQFYYTDDFLKTYKRFKTYNDEKGVPVIAPLHKDSDVLLQNGTNYEMKLEKLKVMYNGEKRRQCECCFQMIPKLRKYDYKDWEDRPKCKSCHFYKCKCIPKFKKGL